MRLLLISIPLLTMACSAKDGVDTSEITDTGLAIQIQMTRTSIPIPTTVPIQRLKKLSMKMAMGSWLKRTVTTATQILAPCPKMATAMA